MPQALNLPHDWQAPPREFSFAPFWFWNDDLDEAEIERQLADFQAHGVHAFVLHPRVGLPRHLAWMSDALLDKMAFAIEQARQRDMWVILYDEGMYPSGSSSGQVVAENSDYQCRGMVCINLDDAQAGSMVQGVQIGADGECILTAAQSLVTSTTYQGTRYAIVDRPIDSVIRGLHYLDESGENPPEDSPPAADLLNPEAVACFIRLVYDRYYERFGPYFGSTIQAIFTDEPMLLGRPRESGLMPGTRDLIKHLDRILGYDCRPHLPSLWDESAESRFKEDFEGAVQLRLEETYYAQLYAWCESHGIALTGHPAEADATRIQRYFHIPGQDIVWRYIEPDTDSALEGRQSTQAKAAASAMLHWQRRRNANEFCGAYGHEFNFDEMRWLAHWLLIRGCNLLIPHAFYYSVRGPRLHERPPDVGPNSAWWNDGFAQFARVCAQLAWLNTDSEQVCDVAILGEQHHLPWRAAKVCYQNQIDFNYLDSGDLLERGIVTESGVSVGNQTYRTLIIDSDLRADIDSWLSEYGERITLLRWSDHSASCLAQLRDAQPPRLEFSPSFHGLRLRQVIKAGIEWTILFNEVSESVELDLPAQDGRRLFLLDPYTGRLDAFDGHLHLEGHTLRLLLAENPT